MLFLTFNTQDKTVLKTLLHNAKHMYPVSWFSCMLTSCLWSKLHNYLHTSCNYSAKL